MNSKGFTLVELMVYLLITAIIAVLSGTMFVNTLKFNKKVEDKISTIGSIDDAFLYLTEDIMRTGAKLIYTDSSYKHMEIVYNHATNDSSSYTITNVGGQDSIYFRTALIDPEGDSLGVEEVSYYIKPPDTLKRMVIKNDTAGVPEVIVVGATQLSFLEGIDSTELLYEDSALANTDLEDKNSNANFLVVTSDSITATVSGFVQGDKHKLVFKEGDDPYSHDSFSAGQKYSFSVSLSFNTEFIANFNPNKDTLQFAIAKAGGELLPGSRKINFFPANVGEKNTYTFSFSVSELVDVAYSPQLIFNFQSNVTGRPLSMTVNEPQLRLTSEGVLIWRNVTDLEEKARVKALKVNLEVTDGGSVRAFNKVIPIPDNGT